MIRPFSTLSLLALLLCAPTAIHGSPLAGSPAHSLTTRQTAVADPQVGVYPAPGSNNYLCRSVHNPVVFLHGLGANRIENINVLQTYLQRLGFCTYALTYGEYAKFPFVGGLKPIVESSEEVSRFVLQVAGSRAGNGRGKVDIVGHSEGAFLSLYVPKFGPGIKNAGIVEKVVAIAPPTHGTTFADLYQLAYVGGNLTRELVGEILGTVGCRACDDLGPGGDAVRRLNDGTPIKQAGTELTVVLSTKDRLVSPYETARVDEVGARNVVVQESCPDDPVGHIGEAYDTWIWGVVVNALDSRFALRPCTKGMPY